MATKTKKWRPPDREQRASDAVVRAAMQWNRAKKMHEIAFGELALRVACARLAAIQKKEKRRVR